MELFHCRARRRFARGLKRKPMSLIKRLRKAKKEAGPLEKPEVRHPSSSWHSAQALESPRQLFSEEIQFPLEKNISFDFYNKKI